MVAGVVKNGFKDTRLATFNTKAVDSRKRLTTLSDNGSRRLLAKLRCIRCQYENQLDARIVTRSLRIKTQKEPKF
jgi:cytochrome c-type biogenesis protein CcmH/NrfF